jgi:hypothetical protein
VVLVPAATTVVAGMGGVGKTQIAARHVRPLWADRAVDLGVWITAANRDAIVSGYAKAADVLGQARDVDPDTAAQALVNWLTTTGRSWVIVLDDLQDPHDLRGLWPPHSGTGHTIVTTRRRDAALKHDNRRIAEVAPYTAYEAASYLHARLADRPDLLEGADDMATGLGQLPLALAQAAAFVIDVEITCREYLRRFRAGRDVKPDTLPDEHQHTVDRTWALSIERADALTPAGLARPLLDLLAVLDPNGVPTTALTTTAVLTYLTERTGRPAHADEATRAVHNLRRLSLATTDPAHHENGVRVHALVQHAVRAAIPAATEVIIGQVAADALLEIWPDIERDTNLVHSLRANTTELDKHCTTHLWTPAGHPILWRLGSSLGSSGLVSSAIGQFQRLRAIATDRLGADHPDTLLARNDLAAWRARTGDVAGAVAEFEQLLADQVRVLGADHPYTLATRNNLASWRARPTTGDAAGAVAEFEQLLADRTRVLGADHPDTLLARNNLASWRAESGNAAGAVGEFEQLLADRTRVLGADHPDTLDTRNNLVSWRAEAGHTAGVVAEFEQLLTDRARVLGADNPNTLVTRNNLAFWRARTGDVAGAVAEFEQLLTDQVRVLGTDHPDTLATRNNLASWRARTGDAAAVAEFEQLLTNQVRILGRDHFDTLLARNNLAFCRAEAGDVTGAVAEFEQLLTDRVRVLGGDHPDTLATRNGLAFWRAEAGDTEGAIAEFQRLHAIATDRLGADHPDTLLARNNLASCRAEAGDVEGAVAEFERLLTDQVRVLAADHPDTLATRNVLAFLRSEGLDPGCWTPDTIGP